AAAQRTGAHRPGGVRAGRGVAGRSVHRLRRPPRAGRLLHPALERQRGVHLPGAGPADGAGAGGRHRAELGRARQEGARRHRRRRGAAARVGAPGGRGGRVRPHLRSHPDPLLLPRGAPAGAAAAVPRGRGAEHAGDAGPPARERLPADPPGRLRGALHPRLRLRAGGPAAVAGADAAGAHRATDLISGVARAAVKGEPRGPMGAPKEIVPGLWHWTTLHPDIKVRVHSYLAEREKVVLDPLLPSGGIAWLRRRGPPEHVVLTTGLHSRHSLEIAEAFGCPVWVPRRGLRRLEPALRAHARGYDSGDRLPGGLRAFGIGVLCPDEFAVLLPK